MRFPRSQKGDLGHPRLWLDGPGKNGRDREPDDASLGEGRLWRHHRKMEIGNLRAV